MTTSPIDVAQSFYEEMSRHAPTKERDLAGRIADAQRAQIIQATISEGLAHAAEALRCTDLDWDAQRECAAGILQEACDKLARLS